MILNLLKARIKCIKPIKQVIFPALIIFIFIINYSAQSIRIEEGLNDKSSICGRIKDEQFTLPSYKFRVTDKNGAVLKNLRTEGELVIVEDRWKRNGFFDFDPYWETVYHNIKVPVFYDFKENVYITQKMPNVKIAKRKKRITKCLDKITQLRFSFYQNDCDLTDFIFFFPNRTVDKINRPSAQKVYNLGIISGYGCVNKD